MVEGLTKQRIMVEQKKRRTQRLHGSIVQREESGLN